MQTVSLQQLLEAGCHFGHKAERWHPKAKRFIYTEKDGIHIIDLAQTKALLEEACSFVKEITSRGDEIVFVATKRQARDVVKQEAEAVGAPYLVSRWIGGFLTNWDSIKKNIEKMNRMAEELNSGAWKKFPKHEQSKLTRLLKRLQIFYAGVSATKAVPSALFIVDIRKEDAAVREATRRGIATVALVDTNCDPGEVTHVVPANDDAVGSIQLITHAIAQAYREGKDLYAKEQKEGEVEQIAKTEGKEEDTEVAEPVKPSPKKRGRPKKAE